MTKKHCNHAELIQPDDYKIKLTFKADWTDWAKSVIKHFVLSFYPCDDSIELFDVDAKKMFLKRSICQGVGIKDMYVGSTIRVYSRQVELVDYGDAYTRDRISVEKEHTIAMIKPSVMNKLGEILNIIHKNNFSILRMKMLTLTKSQGMELYEDKKGDPTLAQIVGQIASGPSITLELVGRDAVNRWRKLIGPANPLEAKLEAPDSLRARYGTDYVSNGFHGSASHEKALREACIFFPQGLKHHKPAPTSLLLKNSTLCLVKPHAIAEGKLGDILDAIIKSKFGIHALQMFQLGVANSEEFLEVYKGVVADFHALSLSLLDGPLVAMEICAKEALEGGDANGINVHDEFRKFAGPSDPDIGRQIRPETLRARFGINKTLNAIHCTDLPEDDELELEYFFKILVSV